MNEFEKLSLERKRLVSEGEIPSWFTTQGWKMFKSKYQYGDETVKGAYNRIANTLCRHVPGYEDEARDKFFDLMWSGKFGPSTPAFTNTGTNRGHSVSCSGGFIPDSVDGFYKHAHEVAMLSKYGYGTSGYLGAIRPRGTPIATGGESDGCVPVFDTMVDVTKKISQGNNRRGNWAGYIEVDSPDFDEVCGYILKNPAEAHIGWIFSDLFIERLKNKDKEAIRRWNRVLYIRSRFGKGYIFKVDTANRLAPDAIKNSNIPICMSNLCSEIMLPSNEDYTFSCVLSSLNLARWDDFDEDTVFWAIVFLDCLVSDMLEKARGVPGFEKIVRFTEEFRALGLGVMGWHTYLQSKDIPFDSLEAQFENAHIFKTIREQAERASVWLAERFGEPKWCKGTGKRNATLMAIAPTTSNAFLCGGVSQGIEPLVGNVFNQGVSSGEAYRINPKLIEVLNKYGKYTDEVIEDIAIHNGSVQHLPYLSDLEKAVLKTAFEIDQFAIIRQASQRQERIDQGQSLNLFFGEDEEYVAAVTKEALLDPRIKSLYYQRSLRGVKPVTCTVCE